MASGDNYSIKWMANQTAPPYTSFAQTYVNISTISGTPSIDHIAWSWISGQLTGYNSNLFQLDNYNASGWTSMNSTPDTTGNTLSLTGLSPQNLYGILQASGNCPIISSGGTYTQSMNYTGAPNDASPLVGTVCVKILASNVIFNCAGYSINNNATGGITFGIVLNGSTNITVKNCPSIYNYSLGIDVYHTNSSNVVNSTASNSSVAALEIDSGYNDSILNATGSASLGYGIEISSSANNTITNSTGYTLSGYGVYLASSSNNTITNSTGFSGSNAGIFLSGSNSNNLTSDNASGSVYGFDLISSNLNNITGDTASNNTDIGLAIDAGSASNTISAGTFCFNNMSDVNNSGSSNIGAGDRCDSFLSWSESGHNGCTYTCSQVWQLFFGNISGNLLLAKDNSQVFYSWIWNGQNGSVYAYNGGVTINWADIIALGRNNSGANSTSDFTTLDALLNTTGSSDSITHLYSVDGSTPNATTNMTIYGRSVPYVPVANSTSASMNVTAKTGIMWDNSTDTNGHYDAADNENVVFVTQINSTAANQYYIRVPSNLSTYKTSAGTVQFWVEMQ